MGVTLFALQRFMAAEAAYFSSIRVSALNPLANPTRRRPYWIGKRRPCRMPEPPLPLRNLLCMKRSQQHHRHEQTKIVSMMKSHVSAPSGGAAGAAQQAAAQDLCQPGHHAGGRRAPACSL